MAILLILCYAGLDIVIGLCVCGLVILYYDSDHTENMLNIDEVVFGETEALIDEIQLIDLDEMQIDSDLYDTNDIVGDDGMYLLPIQSDVKTNTRFTKEKHRRKCKEKMTAIASAKDKFRKDNCFNGELKYKGIPVKKDIAEHIFPELKINHESCNPCNRGCEFSIIEEKLRIEEKMIPISTME
jgi:hypothetical protein